MKIGIAVALLLASTLAHAQQQPAQFAKEKLPDLISLRRELHAHPELSNREKETSDRIARELTRIGVPFERNIAKHGIVATIRGRAETPLVAVRADIDALPVEETIDVPYRSKNAGVKHACGHDAHMTVGVGVAEYLWRERRNLPGSVLVIFQPAEEGPPVGEEGGAPLMLKEGIFSKRKPAAMFALHAMPSHEAGVVSWTPGAEMASADRFRIVVKGKGSHGAAPHMGVDPIVTASQIVTMLQTIASRNVDPLDAVVVTVGSFNAGTRFNIVPDEATMTGTIRTLSPDVRTLTKRRLTELAENVATAAGATARVEFDLGIPVLRNDEKLGEWSEKVLRGELGDSMVRRDPPRMIAEDFAFFADEVPSFYFFLGVGNREKGITAALHTPEFDIDESSLATGVRAMSRLVVDYLAANAP